MARVVLDGLVLTMLRLAVSMVKVLIPWSTMDRLARWNPAQ